MEGSAQISVCLKGRGQCCGVCPPPPPPQQCTTVVDTYYWGGEVASVKADSPGACCAACGGNEDCQAWCETGAPRLAGASSGSQDDSCVKLLLLGFTLA